MPHAIPLTCREGEVRSAAKLGEPGESVGLPECVPLVGPRQP